MNFKALIGFISGFDRGKLLFLGIGNEWRADDAAGLILLRRLKQRPELSDCRFLEAGTNPENYLQDMLDADVSRIIVIDAAKSGNPPGTISMLDKGRFDGSRISTHTYSIDLIEQYLNEHKPIVFYYIGIEPSHTEFDTALSDIMKQKLDEFFQ
jgi:hydrogenase maturation protease